MASTGLPTELSKNGQGYVNHWQSLREGSELPTPQAFLDRADPAFQPLISLNDVDPASGANKVVLFGTALVDLWQVDLTGKDVHDFLTDDQADRLTTDLIHCALTPCGIWELSTLRTTSGRKICWEMVTLPLKANGKGVHRIARYHNILDQPRDGEQIRDILHFQRKEWFDFGHGVPDAAPQMRAS
jgi:hypothetical protein